MKKSSVLFKRILITICLLIIVVAGALLRGHMLVIRTYFVSGHSLGKVKIVGLADLHGEMVGYNQEQIIAKVKEANPDFILYLGEDSSTCE